MIFRVMKECDRDEVYEMTYNEWGNGVEKVHYYRDNLKEEMTGGVRYVLIDQTCVVSSLIIKPWGIGYVIGSVVTGKKYRKRGYASILMEKLIMKYPDTIFFLYSDINPSFYSRFGFTALPDHCQSVEHSSLMVKCDAEFFHHITSSVNLLPVY